MDKLYNLKERLIKELESYGSKANLNASDLDIAMKLSSAVKNLCKIIDGEEGEGYSSRGYAYGMDNSVEPGRDMSYARGRRNAPRDSMGRYSGEMGYSRHGDPADQLRELMEQAPDEQTRRDLERVLRRMERT
jgi:hypothetical protein